VTDRRNALLRIASVLSGCELSHPATNPPCSPGKTGRFSGPPAESDPAANGALHITSAEGKGTTVTLSFPPPDDVTPLYSLRENAIAKEPGLSYPE
jgi:hypothetical protein